MGSQNNYLNSHFSTLEVNIQLLVAMAYETMQKKNTHTHTDARNGYLHGK